MKRNLIYCIYPLRDSVWKWNIRQMRQYLPYFDGKKIVTVSEDVHTDKASDVAKEFDCPDADIVALANDPVLQQTKAFIPSLERVASLDKNEATFYAFAKGVTRGTEYMANVIAWTWAQYFLNLTCIDLVDHLLKRYSTVGAFRHPAPYSKSAWHYSGAFFWFRHDALFSKNWRDVHPDRYGVEYYLGRHIPLSESYDLAEGRTNEADGTPKQLYWRRIYRMECETWLAESMAKERPV